MAENADYGVEAPEMGADIEDSRRMSRQMKRYMTWGMILIELLIMITKIS